MKFSDMYLSRRKRSLFSVGKQNENFNQHFSQNLLMSVLHMEKNSYSYIRPSILKEKMTPPPQFSKCILMR